MLIQPSETVYIVLETVNAKAGAKGVEVKVFIQAEPHWSGVYFTLNFDPSNLTFKGFELNPAICEQNDNGEMNAFCVMDKKSVCFCIWHHFRWL